MSDHVQGVTMKFSRIATVMFLCVCFTSAGAGAETVQYQCDGNSTGFKVDTSSSTVTLESYGYFGNFTIIPPVHLTRSTAQWQMKNKLDASCSYVANATFYKITNPITITTQCPSANGAQVVFSGKCQGGGGTQTFYCCAKE